MHREAEAKSTPPKRKNELILACVRNEFSVSVPPHRKDTTELPPLENEHTLRLMDQSFVRRPFSY